VCVRLYVYEYARLFVFKVECVRLFMFRVECVRLSGVEV
jgi:hypothetical protein